ncbi:MAG: hypothetical protein A3C70_03335 [Candidatus Zambryskibacteria bacterium RIFCSPHIGHO2_02_FULL_43_14]|uniref:IrrE N-terminal-like domain-containing protein n=1 Tax=Candidatus Zambryskibacteria bacterium RIFCSPHIGHO2_02_FULL_43_14 TaxID=1802748 RepID=A0A1G2TG50_9BACT|nr:MAG: hypothetical protein A2829_02560 [Candidatus Zambryskibacteria bacterium RIFCSPHIGHO2_01_FULL_43_60]OHA96277.1 MAG: hypothetical protein A3C70_03335 [Candidatus Zambryskibacteria bacterium RIFCSPHIGHO2_02_FULL_43_14]
MYYELRWDEWEPCVLSGRSVTQLLERTLVEWRNVEQIEDRMIALGVEHIKIEDTMPVGRYRKAGGFVRRISNSPMVFEIILDSTDSILTKIFTLGHELGHLEARQLGSRRLDPDVLRGRSLGDPEFSAFLQQSYIEEAFADKFGEAWFAVERHRKQARRLLVQLLRTSS